MKSKDLRKGAVYGRHVRDSYSFVRLLDDRLYRISRNSKLELAPEGAKPTAGNRAYPYVTVGYPVLSPISRYSSDRIDPSDEQWAGWTVEQGRPPGGDIVLVYRLGELVDADRARGALAREEEERQRNNERQRQRQDALARISAALGPQHASSLTYYHGDVLDLADRVAPALPEPGSGDVRVADVVEYIAEDRDQTIWSGRRGRVLEVRQSEGSAELEATMVEHRSGMWNGSWDTWYSPVSKLRVVQRAVYHPAQVEGGDGGRKDATR